MSHSPDALLPPNPIGPPLAAGTRLAQYEIRGTLGEGGMGRVYRARDLRLDRDVAIKMLADHLAQDDEMIVRFEREARAVAALSHPNIRAIHELALVNGRLFAVMELLEGESLRAVLQRAPLPWRQAAEIAIGIAQGLAAAHDKQIVHRDLKPENVFVTADGRVKILDFGLARTRSPLFAVQDDSATTIGLLTQAGTVLGTLGYMSPEQVRGGEVEPASDVFSFGCLLYEMLTGRRAFARDSPAETMAAVLADAPAPLDRGHDVPAALEAVLWHCLKKDPGDRFPSARDVSLALQGMLNQSGLTAAPGRRRRGPGTRALAVLPFENLSGDPDLAYLGDGLAESITNALGSLPKMRVVPRSTAFRYKHRQEDHTTIALALNVRYLLTGRVLQYGETLGIQADLIDVPRQAQIWGEHYTRTASDIFMVQEEIAGEIVDALRLRLTGAERTRLSRRDTESPAAYEAYLRGRHYWNRWSAEDFRLAVRWFQEAIDRDPKYALAHAGLADTYVPLAYYGYLPPAEGMPRAREAAARALALQPGLPEAHTAMGLIHLFYDYDRPAAARALRRALALNPRHALGHTFLALLFATAARHEEALTAAKRALAIEPLALVAQAGVGWVLYFARRYEEAIQQFRGILELEPYFSQADHVLNLVYERIGGYRQAAAHLERVLAARNAIPAGATPLTTAAQDHGAEGYWVKRLEIFEQLARSSYVPPHTFARTYASLGDKDQAFVWLARTRAERGGQIAFLEVDPSLDPLRNDPRFDRLLQEVGLQEID
jgi:eukaryotic-like serine/threonine-protein kinase